MAQLSILCRFVSRSAPLIPLLLCIACGNSDPQSPPPVPGANATPVAASSAPNPDKNNQGDAATLPDDDALTSTSPRGYLDKQQKDSATAPFSLTISRIGLEGGCARGDSTDTRPDAPGIHAVIEGTLKYTGSDLLYDAQLDGALFLQLKDSVYRSAPVFSGPDFLNFETNRASRILPAVRGAAPWYKGEVRKFQFKTAALNEVYCELIPQRTTVFMAIRTNGVVAGEATSAIAVSDLSFDEVLGMALRQEVQVEEKKQLEPADAHFCRLDKILVTRLDGKTEWLSRDRVVHPEPLSRAKGPNFPVDGTGGVWQVKVTAAQSLEEYGGYAPKGEDQFLHVLDIEIVNSSGSDESIKDMKFRLEGAPGVWVAPASNSQEQIETSEPLAAGSSITGKIVFPRQRFERPFRLEVTTPDKAILYLDIFSYKTGPERSPL